MSAKEESLIKALEGDDLKKPKKPKQRNMEKPSQPALHFLHFHSLLNLLRLFLFPSGTAPRCAALLQAAGPYFTRRPYCLRGAPPAHLAFCVRAPAPSITSCPKLAHQPKPSLGWKDEIPTPWNGLWVRSGMLRQWLSPLCTRGSPHRLHIEKTSTSHLAESGSLQHLP